MPDPKLSKTETAQRHCWTRLRPHDWKYSHYEGSNGFLYETSVYTCARCGAEKRYEPGPAEIR